MADNTLDISGWFAQLVTALTPAWESFLQFAQYIHLGDITKAVLLTLAMPWVFNGVRLVFIRLIQWIAEAYPFPPIKLRGLELASGKQVSKALEILVKSVYTLVQLWVVYLYISILFSFFSATKNVGLFLLSLVGQLSLQLWMSIVAYLPNLISIGLILLVSTYGLKFIRLLLDGIATESIIFEGFHKDWAAPTYKILRFLIAMMVLIMIFPLLPGFDSPAFQGVGVFLGLLLSIGSSSAIANIVAGTVLIYTRSFNVGDRIESNGVVGDVVEKTLLVTRIETVNHEIVTVPNSEILNSATINYSELAAGGDGLILHAGITIGYDVDWRKVHQLLLSAAEKTQHVEKSPEPVVFQKSLDDFYVAYELRVSTRQPGRMMTTYSELYQYILDEFHSAGVEICSPHYRANRDHALALPPMANKVNPKTA